MKTGRQKGRKEGREGKRGGRKDLHAPHLPIVTLAIGIISKAINTPKQNIFLM